MSHIPYSVRQIPRSMLNQSTQGAKGLTGERGIPGQDGERGNHGNHGQDGNDGPPGPRGIQGVPGNDGPPGPRGIQGVQGPAGNDGFIGRDGSLSTLETFIVTSPNVNVSSVATPMYHINGVKQSDLKLTSGFTYRFDTSDSSNQGHTLNFSYLQGATNQSYVAASKYTSSVSFAETTKGGVIASGTTGSYTEITITDSTPEKLYYYGESGMHYTQHTTGGLQKITHSTLRTQLIPDITYSNSSRNGENRTNKFLKAINADGSQAQWTSFSEGNDAIPQILCNQVSATSGAFSSLTASVISCPTVCAVNELLAGGDIKTSGTLWTRYIESFDTDLILKTVNASNGVDSEITMRPFTITYGSNDHFFVNSHNQNNCTLWVNGSSIGSSDDRLKHNEVDVKDALSTIRKLHAQKYQKTSEPKDANFTGELTENFYEETGFIAQDVLKIPELSYCVKEGMTGSGHEIYYLNYQDLFVYAVAGLKELDAKVTTLEARLAALENR